MLTKGGEQSYITPADGRIVQPREGFPAMAIRIEAFKMARSGDFTNCDAIEAALERMGHVRARSALRHPITRAHLDELCIRSMQASNQRVPASPKPDGVPSTTLSRELPRTQRYEYGKRGRSAT